MSVSIPNIAQAAFDALAASAPDTVRIVSYEATGAQTYNAATDTLTNVKTTYIGVSAVMTGYSRKEREVDFQSSRRQLIEAGDMKCLIPYKALPITPSMEDIIIDGSTRWRIVEHSLDPTGVSLHTFQLRRA